jgi:PRTRC genetic system protein B
MPTERSTTITPEQALILYRVQPSSSGYGDSALVLDHSIHTADEQMVIGAGKVVSHATLERLLALLQSGTEPADAFLPANVLVATTGRLVWWVKSGVRSMHFNIGGRYQCLTVPWPALLFKVNEGRLSVVGLRGTRRPVPGTRLFHAPLFNVGANGGVCTGSAVTPSAWTVGSRSAWESVIYDTNFSHSNHSRTLAIGAPDKPVTDAAHLRFWRKLARDQATRFPAEALAPMNTTLQHWI